MRFPSCRNEKRMTAVTR